MMSDDQMGWTPQVQTWALACSGSQLGSVGSTVSQSDTVEGLASYRLLLTRLDLD